MNVLLFYLLLAAPAAPPPRPAAPGFTLPDTAGRSHTLRDFRGRPLVLFFFCGCVPCHACAQLWAQSEAGETPPPVTLVVFSGDAPAARTFALETGLDIRRNVLLVDPLDRAGSAYRVTACPRVFIVDARGRVRYTNDEPETDPQTTPAVSLVSRALSAWRLAR